MFSAIIAVICHLAPVNLFEQGQDLRACKHLGGRPSAWRTGIRISTRVHKDTGDVRVPLEGSARQGRLAAVV